MNTSSIRPGALRRRQHGADPMGAELVDAEGSWLMNRPRGVRGDGTMTTGSEAGRVGSLFEQTRLHYMMILI